MRDIKDVFEGEYDFISQSGTWKVQLTIVVNFISSKVMMKSK